MQFPLIETERLVLSEFNEEHTDELFSIFSNPSVTEFYDCNPFLEIAQAEQIIRKYIRQLLQNPIVDFRWAIFIKGGSNNLIGTCGFHHVNKEFHSIEIGYDIHPNYWGKGFATEAVLAMIRFCTSSGFPFDINRITATTNLDAVKSINVLRKIGFTEEGILRQYGFWKGKYHDVKIFSILKHELSRVTNK